MIWQISGKENLFACLSPVCWLARGFVKRYSFSFERSPQSASHAGDYGISGLWR
jgi:hypothetical protein